MEIKFPEQPDPQSNLVEFKHPKKREGTMIPVRRNYDDCKHPKFTVNESTRTVECQTCKTQMDAFNVLYEMAIKQRRWLEEMDEWDARRQSLLSERYDEEWGKCKDDIIEPPSDPTLRRIWDVFQAYYGSKFTAMYRRKQRLRTGPEWYGKSTYGACVSYEYARHQLIPKAVQSEV